MLNDDQRGGHDEVGACYSAVRGPLARGESPEDITRTLGWLDKVWAEVLQLREENAALALRLERDAVTYATMQKGMESQAELMDGLKQRCRELERARDVLFTENATLWERVR